MKRYSHKKTIQIGVENYTSSIGSLTTVIDFESMKRVYENLDNPPAGTASLDELLQRIENEKHASFLSI